MPEEERLELVSTVDDEFSEPLERLESALESVDDEIRQTGRGRDHVEIHTEVRGAGQAISELEALDSALKTLDDDITLDVDTDFDNVLRDDVRVNADGQGSQFISGRTGQFTSTEEALDRRFSEISDAVEDEMSVSGDVNIDAANVDVDAAHGDNDGISPDASAGVADNDGKAVRTSGGTEDALFTVENIGEWEDAAEPFLDREELGRRGGEADRIGDVLDQAIEDVVDFDDAVDLAVDDDSDIDLNTLQEVDTPGVQGTMEAIGELDDAGETLLGSDGGLRKEVGRFKQELGGLRPTMQGFHAAIAATLPLLGVFLGAIPAAVVGLGALATAAVGAAAALGGIVGLGAIGVMLAETGELDTQPLQERLAEVGDSFVDAFAPLASSLAPTIEYAISEIEAMMGPLAAANSGLLQFRDDFQAATGFVTSALPSFTAELLAFSEAAMPLVSGLMQTIAGMDFFGYLGSQLSEALPELMMLGDALDEILPAVVNLSQGFLTVAAVIGTSIGMVVGLMNLFPGLTTALGTVAAGMLTVVAVSGLWQIAVAGLTGQLVGLATTLVTNVVTALNAHIASLIGVQAASWGAYVATAAFLGLLTFGVVPALASAASGFNLLGGNINDARKELEKFAAVNNGFGGVTPMAGAQPTRSGATNPYSNTMPSGGSSTNLYQDQSTTVIYADDRDSAARQQYSSEYERKQHRDSVFGN